MPRTTVTAPSWTEKYSDRARGIKGSAIRELLQYLGTPGMISFAGGLPAPSTFPVPEISKAINGILDNSGRVITALQYGPTEGYRPLREYLAQKMSKYGVPATADNVIITSGSQQALDLIGKVFVDKKTRILTERPTYLGALQAWDAYEGKYCTVPIDSEGLQVDELPAVIEKYHPKFIYIIPNFHNPGGVCMSAKRRQKLVEVARKYDLFIVEDDPYGDLRYEGEHIVPVVSLAPERTFYLCTFSKTLAPGLRIGWVVAPEEAIRKLVQAKQGTDLFTSMELQMAVYDICASGILPGHVKTSAALYEARRDAMLEELIKEMPNGIDWTEPKGGLFLWLTVPDKVNVADLFKAAIAENVAFVMGSPFYPNETTLNGRKIVRPEALHTMRLNFSAENPETIKEGVKRLARAMKNELAK